jgi:hypothetical protein
VPIARATVRAAGSVGGLVAQCRADGVAMLIARCPARDVAAAQALEAAGGRVMDVLVYAARDLVRTPIAEHALDGLLRSATPADAGAVARVAKLGFAGYQSHYHADPRLDTAACDAAYVEWARRSCESRAVADEVVVAEAGGEVVGFATVKRLSAVEADAVLFAAAPGAERHGVYRSDLYAALMLRVLRWAKAAGARRVITSRKSPTWLCRSSGSRPSSRRREPSSRFTCGWTGVRPRERSPPAPARRRHPCASRGARRSLGRHADLCRGAR